MSWDRGKPRPHICSTHQQCASRHIYINCRNFNAFQYILKHIFNGIVIAISLPVPRPHICSTHPHINPSTIHPSINTYRSILNALSHGISHGISLALPLPISIKTSTLHPSSCEFLHIFLPIDMMLQSPSKARQVSDALQ